MSFKIIETLVLDEAKNEQVNLVPTSKYFKPVLIITAPLGPEVAKMIGANWAFDEMGNPQPFEGTIKLLVELARAQVTLTSTISGEVRLQTETVKHLAVFRQEKTGMRLRMRCHLPDNKEQLWMILDFLSKLNKEAFSVAVTPESLFTANSSEGAPIVTAALQYPFNITKGRKTMMVGNISTAPVDGGYVGGWECKAVALAGSPADGKAASDANEVFGLESNAKEWAAAELLVFAKHTLKPDSLAEVQAVADLVDWIVEQAPGLKKDETGKLHAMPAATSGKAKVQ